MEAKEETIKRLSQYRVAFLDKLNCTIVDASADPGTCQMEFHLDNSFCHSVDVIQGGFVTAMLDAVTSHATFAARTDIIGLSTLELKVTFYAASRAGKLIASGRVEKMGRSIVFLEGELRNAEGVKTAGITSTAKVSIKK